MTNEKYNTEKTNFLNEIGNLFDNRFKNFLTENIEVPPIEPIKEAKYYVSLSGDDSNIGTIEKPFASINKLNSVIKAGELAHVRGGVYTDFGSYSDGSLVLLKGLNGTDEKHIKIENYPGEKVVFDLKNYKVDKSFCFAFQVTECSYLDIKGIEIKNFAQFKAESSIFGFIIGKSKFCNIEQVHTHHIGGYGISIGSDTSDINFINCDTSYCSDNNMKNPYKNANGFNCTAKTNVNNIHFEGCRAWKNSDDGWDLFKSNGVFTLKNCWAFDNGYDDNMVKLGDGQGFKIGPTYAYENHSTEKLRFLDNCIAAGNYKHGFDQNVLEAIAVVSNCKSLLNNVYGYFFPYHNNIVHEFSNNIAFGNKEKAFGLPKENKIIFENNKFTELKHENFVSLDIKELSKDRDINGNLPVINFGKLAI